MKKTILVVLMVALIVTPCFAQEVEPDGLFSVERTKWLVTYIEPDKARFSHYCGFYGGKVYTESEGEWVKNDDSFYIDLIAVCFFARHYPPNRPWPYSYFYNGVMTPLGIGIAFESGFDYDSQRRWLDILLMFRSENNWTPPSE